jgi:hypothetical protein
VQRMSMAEKRASIQQLPLDFLAAPSPAAAVQAGTRPSRAELMVTTKTSGEEEEIEDAVPLDQALARPAPIPALMAPLPAPPSAPEPPANAITHLPKAPLDSAAASMHSAHLEQDLVSPGYVDVLDTYAGTKVPVPPHGPEKMLKPQGQHPIHAIMARLRPAQGAPTWEDMARLVRAQVEVLRQGSPETGVLKHGCQWVEELEARLDAFVGKVVVPSWRARESTGE